MRISDWSSDVCSSDLNSLDQTQEPVQVSLDDEGRVYIDDVETLMSDLPERFVDIRKTKGDAQESPQVYLRADRGLDYGQVMPVMGELNRAGFNRVADRKSTTLSSSP